MNKTPCISCNVMLLAKNVYYRICTREEENLQHSIAERCARYSSIKKYKRIRQYIFKQCAPLTFL